MMNAASIPELVLAAARDSAIRTRQALWTDERRLDYSQLEDAIARSAGLLLASGLKRRERVGLLAGRTAAAASAVLGVMAAGGAVCVLDERLAPAELGARLQSAEIGWILADATHFPLAAAANPRALLRLEDAAQAKPRLVEDLGPDDDALLVLTSGSTGHPKAVLLTHSNLLSNTRGIVERTAITPADRVLHNMPMHHTNGVNNQLIVPWACGASVVLLEHFRAETFFAEITRHRPTYFTGVPTHYSRLLACTPPPGSLASVRFARGGAAPLNAELHRKIEAHLGVPLVMSYGLSEGTCTCTMNPPAARKIGTVGTALYGQRVAIFAPETEDPVATNAEGEICIAGPSVMKGYVPADAHTDRPSIRHGWLRTGDLGQLDAEGYLTVTGRLKDIIIRGGENLSPGRIEEALTAHPAVRACCVVGAPDPDLGEVPVAYITTNSGQSVPESDLKDQVASRLPHSWVPARVTVLDALPENRVGKIDRQALKQLAADA
jgi:acyl-CoA synthetase (AMP-forming)/AMP-acid ligase II